MTPFIPPRFEQLAFALLVTFCMTLIISGISTVLALGVSDPAFLGSWMGAWMASWMVAFPAAVIVMPLARRMIARMVVRS